jgi:hypothetical protein
VAWRFSYSNQQLILDCARRYEEPEGELESHAVRLDFDRRLMLQFRGFVVTSDAGLLAYRELDDAIGLTMMASDVLADARTGKDGRHALAGLFRPSVFGRLAEGWGYRSAVRSSKRTGDDCGRARTYPAAPFFNSLWSSTWRCSACWGAW